MGPNHTQAKMIINRFEVELSFKNRVSLEGAANYVAERYCPKLNRCVRINGPFQSEGPQIFYDVYDHATNHRRPVLRVSAPLDHPKWHKTGQDAAFYSPLRRKNFTLYNLHCSKDKFERLSKKLNH